MKYIYCYCIDWDFVNNEIIHEKRLQLLSGRTNPKWFSISKSYIKNLDGKLIDATDNILYKKLIYKLGCILRCPKLTEIDQKEINVGQKWCL